jgi:hypothetical protein
MSSEFMLSFDKCDQPDQITITLVSLLELILSFYQFSVMAWPKVMIIKYFEFQISALTLLPPTEARMLKTPPIFSTNFASRRVCTDGGSSERARKRPGSTRPPASSGSSSSSSQFPAPST